jgi:TolB-like protein/tetratricopeptide (TPR) repeat protein
MADLRGTTILSRYRLIEPLGVGAMGEVWNAEDLQLQRRVAVKLIADHLTRDRDAVERMFREAQAAAGVDHPGVVAIYEAGFHGDRAFIVMQKVEGVPLRAQLDCGAFTIADAVGLIRPLAEALAEVHSVGIVHRDLKPANILMTPRGPKIVDFGLASLRGAPRLTMEGAVVGTPIIMSPEQFRGETCDHRTDLWALGCIFYECLVGRAPFGGNTMFAVMNAVLNDDPPSPSRVRSEVPNAIDFLVMKLLRKDPGLRYAKAEDFLVDLRSVEQEVPGRSDPAESAPAALPRLAVAYMEAPGADADTESLAMGISEGLMVELSKDRRLKVVGRTEVAGVRHRLMSARTIAREIGVDYVVVGALRSSGSRIRATIQLVRTADGDAIWAERYERALEPAGSFEIEEDLIGTISTSVRDALLADGDTTGGHSADGQAQSLFQRAQDYLDIGDRASNERAEVFLRMAVSRDANAAHLHAALAACYAMRLQAGWASHETASLAEEYADLALAREATLPDGYLARAIVATWRGEDAQAREALRQLWRCAPNRVAALESGAICAITLGHWAEAMVVLRPQLDRHPGRGEVAEMLALACELSSRGEEAQRSWRRARDGFMDQIRMRSDDAIARARLGGALARVDDPERARIQLDRATENGRIEPTLAYYAACAYAMLGDAEEALELLTYAVADLPKPARRRLSADPRLFGLGQHEGFQALVHPGPRSELAET